MVGAPGFEPGTSCAQGKRATRLRHAPPSHYSARFLPSCRVGKRIEVRYWSLGSPRVAAATANKLRHAPPWWVGCGLKPSGISCGSGRGRHHLLFLSSFPVSIQAEYSPEPASGLWAIGLAESKRDIANLMRKCMRAGVRPGLQILWVRLWWIGRFDSDTLPPTSPPRKAFHRRCRPSVASRRIVSRRIEIL